MKSPFDDPDYDVKFNALLERGDKLIKDLYLGLRELERRGALDDFSPENRQFVEGSLAEIQDREGL